MKDAIYDFVAATSVHFPIEIHSLDAFASYNEVVLTAPKCLFCNQSCSSVPMVNFGPF